MELTYEGLGIYPIWKIYTFFFPNLDASASMLRPKLSMNFPHSIIFTVKMGSGLYLFSAKRLKVSKLDPEVIGLICKIYTCLHCCPKVYCNTTYCPCRDFGKILKLHFELSGTQDMMKTFSFADPF